MAEVPPTLTPAEAEDFGPVQYELRVAHIKVPRCPYCTATTKQRCYGTVKCETGQVRYYRCGHCHHPGASVGGPSGDNHTRYKATVG